MKKLKFGLCMVMCLIMLLASIPAYAASSAAEIQSRLSKIAATDYYGKASYTKFNTRSMSGCYAFIYRVSQELYGVPIPSHAKNNYGYWTRFAANSNWECVGIADNNSRVGELLKQAQSGDLIQYRSDKTNPQHTLMVYDVTSAGITFWGSDATNGAKITKRFAWGALAGSKPANSKWSVGLGDFSAAGCELSLYRCTRDVLSGDITGGSITNGNNNNGGGQQGNASGSVTTTQAVKQADGSYTLYGTASAGSGRLSAVGMNIGTSKENLRELGKDSGGSNTTAKMWYNTKKYKYTLQPGMTYYYQAYAVVNGKTVYGDTLSFTIPGPTPVPPEPQNTSVQVYWYEDGSRFTASNTNATLAVKGTTGDAVVADITEIGVYLYDEQENYLAGYSRRGSYDGKYEMFHVAYDVNDDLGYTLTSGTTYNYRFYAIVNGERRSSHMFSFTTN